jgi:hypothetical protein
MAGRHSRNNRKILRLESHHQPLLSRPKFALRLLLSILAASLFVGFSLMVGMWGYHHFESMPWIDAFVNAAMILSGMGPMGELKTHGGKLFAGFYALYSGLAVVLATGLILAPVIHRILHRFHLPCEKN